MRKVMFAMNVSIDGCYEHFHFMPDPELMDYFTSLMQDTGIIVYGRKTYELMVPYWPDVAKSKNGSSDEIAFAEAMTPIEKIVLSRTIKTAEANTRIINADPDVLIRQLKQQSGKKIAFSSSTMLPRMLEEGLIDELNLVVHPILVGENKHLFNLLVVKTRFTLKATKIFRSGTIALQYQKNE